MRAMAGSARDGTQLRLGSRAREARRLWLRGRRAALGFDLGPYRSAFRGAGVEFEELRPYLPGDDVRAIDWNATARSGQVWVRHYREERSRALLLALDVSKSMRFSSTGVTKARRAAEAAALLAAVAAGAGDRVGLVAFDEELRGALPPRRGEAHGWALVGRALSLADRCSGSSALAPALAWIEGHARRGDVVVLLSDLRLAPFEGGSGAAAEAKDRLVSRLRVLARRHEFVAIGIGDPRETILETSRSLWLRADEGSGSGRGHLHAGDPRVRAAYRAAARARLRRVERLLREVGADCIWLSTARDPLASLTRFLRERAGQRRLRAPG